MQVNSIWLWPSLAGAFVVALGVVWLACRRVYGRKLAAAAHRLARSDQARLAAQKQVAQALQQVQALRRELEVERRRRIEVVPQPSRSLEAEPAWQSTDTFTPAEARRDPGAEVGFADTQILA